MPANEIFFFDAIFNFTVQQFARELKLIPKDEPVTVLLNSPGGDVFAGWSLASLIAERKGPVELRIFGHAASMAAMMPLFADNTMAMDVTSFMIHKAVFDPGEELSDEDQAMLDKVNADLFAKLKARIDDRKLKELTGFRLKQIFGPGDRVDVWLTAKQAKSIGLIDKITNLNAMQAGDTFGSRIAAHYQETITANTTSPNLEKAPDQSQDTNKIVMNLEKFKAEHPEVYAEAFAAGVAAEKDRVGAWAKFIDIDPKAVAEGIQSGDDMSQTAMADFSVKMISATQKKQIQEDSSNTVETDEVETVDEKTADVKAFESQLNKRLGITINQANHEQDNNH